MKCYLAFCQDHLPLNCRNYIPHASGVHSYSRYSYWNACDMLISGEPTSKFAEKQYHNAIAHEDKAKELPTLFKYGLDTLRRP